MNQLFESSDILNNPCECFICSNLLHSLPVRPHFHYFVEILYLTEGSILAECNEQSFFLSKGDMILFFPSSVHALYTVSDAPFCYEVLKFDPAAFGSHALGSFGSIPDFSSLLFSGRKKVSASTEKSPANTSAGIYFPAETLTGLPVSSIFHTCVVEAENKQYGFQSLLHTKILELLTYVLRIWRQNGFDTDTLYTAAGQYDSIYSITAYIDAHLEENLKVNMLAARCGMSYSYFAKNFREVYGQSCKKYMESLRLSKAENLLLFTNLDLTYISQETGFSDCSHLIHAFRTKYGVTPHQYRLQHHT